MTTEFTKKNRVFLHFVCLFVCLGFFFMNVFVGLCNTRFPIIEIEKDGKTNNLKLVSIWNELAKKINIYSSTSKKEKRQHSNRRFLPNRIGSNAIHYIFIYMKKVRKRFNITNHSKNASLKSRKYFHFNSSCQSSSIFPN